MGTVTRTRLLMAAFCLSLCGLGVTAGARQLAQVAVDGPMIIDDGDPGFTHVGFSTARFLGAYNDDTAYVMPATPFLGQQPKAQWTFKAPGAGTHKLYVTWKEHGMFTTDAKLSISTTASPTPVSAGTLNQAIAPKGETHANRQWTYVRDVVVTGTEDVTLTIEPGSNTKLYTVADAAMLVRGRTPSAICKPPRPSCFIGIAECCPDYTWACPNGATGASGCRAPAVSVCGNGKTEPGEQCDDGNQYAFDGCSAQCQACPFPACAAPEPGCRYVQDGRLNANGCPANPCGTLVCDVSSLDMNACLNNPSYYWDQQTNSCIQDYRACSDPDNGDNLFVAGHTFGFRKYATGGDKDKRIRTGGKDACLNSQSLIEHTCVDTYFIESKTVSCPVGTECVNGACTRTPTNVTCGWNAGYGWSCEQMSQEKCRLAGGTAFTSMQECTALRTACNNGIDDDKDGLVDLKDPGCENERDNDETNVPATACSDGRDNDGDGLADMADKGCTNPQGQSEAGPTDLSVGLTADPANVAKGETVTVNSTLHNFGPDNVTTPVEYSISLPTGVTYDSARSNPACAMRGAALVCRIPTLKIGNTSMPLRFVVGENAACGQATMTSTVLASPQGDPNAANNTASVSFGVTCAANPPVKACPLPPATRSVLQNQSLTGDVDRNGTVDQKDLNEILLYIQHMSAGRTPSQYVAPDVDGNRTVDVQDALQVVVYLRCIQPRIVLSSAALSCVNGVSSLTMTYQANGIDAMLHALDENGGIRHVKNLFNPALTTVTAPLSDFTSVAAGTKLKLCHGNNYNVCSTTLPVTGAPCAPQAETVTLTSVVLAKDANNVDVANVTYAKNFDTCVHMLPSANKAQALHRQNHFCARSETKIVPLLPTTANPFGGLNIKENDEVILCHGNNYATCSAPAKVTKAATNACANIPEKKGVKFQNQTNPLDVNDDGKIENADGLLIINHLNTVGAGTLTNGTPPPFIDVNGDNSASALDALLIVNYLNAGCGTTTPTNNAMLDVTVKNIGTTNTAVRNQKNVNLLRFDAQGNNQDPTITRVVAKAAAGNLLNAQNYTLWADSDGNGSVDTIVQTGVAAQNNLVSFNDLADGGFMVSRSAPTAFEIHADIASSTVNNELQLALATETPGYVTAEIGNGVNLGGIRTNGTCPGTTCMINVTTTPSITYVINNQDLPPPTLSDNATCNSMPGYSFRTNGEVFAGKQFQATIVMDNPGQSTWTVGPNAPYTLVLHADTNATWGTPKATYNPMQPAETAVKPGQVFSFDFWPLQAPATPGTYPIKVQMQKNGVAFGSVCTHNVVVKPAAAQPALVGDNCPDVKTAKAQANLFGSAAKFRQTSDGKFLVWAEVVGGMSRNVKGVNFDTCETTLFGSIENNANGIDEISVSDNGKILYKERTVVYNGSAIVSNLYLVDRVTKARTLVTNMAASNGTGDRALISRDGNSIVMTAWGADIDNDPATSINNADGSRELFIIRNGIITQLTNFNGGQSTYKDASGKFIPNQYTNMNDALFEDRAGRFISINLDFDPTTGKRHERDVLTSAAQPSGVYSWEQRLYLYDTQTKTFHKISDSKSVFNRSTFQSLINAKITEITGSAPVTRGFLESFFARLLGSLLGPLLR